MVSPIPMLAADTGVTFTATVVIAGIVIVVGMLLLLIFIFNLFGKFVPVIEKWSNALSEKMAFIKTSVKAKWQARKKNTASESETESLSENREILSANPAADLPKPVPVVEAGISGEIVAAIAAAVAVSEGPDAVVHSIKRKNINTRNLWAAAAAADNTRPF